MNPATKPRIPALPVRSAGPARSHRRRRAAGTLSLVLLTGAIAAIVAGSRLIPLPSPQTPLQQPLPITLGSPELTCPGPETLAVPSGGTPVAAPAPVWLSALTGSGRNLAVAGVRAYGKGSQLAVKAASPARTGDRMRITAREVPVMAAALALNKLGPVVVSGQTPPGADPAPELAGVQSTVARSGDLRGLAATTCSVAASSSWLVGGGTKSGERLRLLLSNPLRTPAVADIEVHGPAGLVSAPSGDGVVVPGEQTLAVYIDALAPGLERVAVHVAVRSGRVTATMHDSVLRGLAPGGTDDVSASAKPAMRQVIPGVALAGGYTRTASDPAAPGSTSVRIAVPGSEEAVVRVRLTDSTGTVDLPNGAVLNIPGGGVADVPIAGVPSKTYTAIVESDVPVVASARVGRTGPPASPGASEFGWAASANAVSGMGYAVLPRETQSTLVLAAADDAASVEVREVAAGGALSTAQTLQLNSGTSISVRASDTAVALRIQPGDGGAVDAALVSTSEDPHGQLISIPQVHISGQAPPRGSAVADPRLGLR